MTTLEQRGTLGWTLRAIVTLLACAAVAAAVEAPIIVLPVRLFGLSPWVDLVTAPLGFVLGWRTFYKTARALLPVGEPLEPWGERGE